MSNKTSEAKKVTKKAKADAEAIRKQQAKESVKLASVLAEIEKLEKKSTYL